MLIKDPQPTAKKLLSHTIQTFILGTIFSTSICTAAPIKHEPVSLTKHYLDPSVWTITVNENECFLAAPNSILQVEPSTSDNGNRAYKITQFFDEDRSKELYAQSIDQQIQAHKIVGREFCAGIVSISNMDLPFVKGYWPQDANDGLLITDKMRHALANIDDHILGMISLAVKASSGTYSYQQLADMDVEFQAKLNEIDHIAQVTQFHGYPLLKSGSFSMDIPISGSLGVIHIPLGDFSIGSAGLNILDLSISSNSNAQNALNSLMNLSSINKEFAALQATDISLNTAAKLDADITMVDVRTDNFIVQHDKASLTLKNKIHS